MIAIPFAVLLAFVSSLCHCMLGGVLITGLSAPGLILSVIFAIQLFLNFLLFDEIPTSHRRLPLNSTSNAFVDNSQLTPYISDPETAAAVVAGNHHNT